MGNSPQRSAGLATVRATRTATAGAPKAAKTPKAAKPAAVVPVTPPTVEEQKAAAERRFSTAKTQATRAERAVTAATKAAEAKRAANAAEITRLSDERHAAFEAHFESARLVRDAIAEERARAKGEAGKTKTAVANYQKMLAAKQPYEDAKVAYETAKATAGASDAHAQALQDRYIGQYDTARVLNWPERMRKDHPDYKAASTQRWKDSSAADKAQRAFWRKESAYKGPRDKLAGKITDAQIEAHPTRVATQAALAVADAHLGEATGDTALRAAVEARERARDELHQAQTALAHPTWKYPLNSAPIRPAAYTSPDQWSAGTLNAARKADTGVHDRHVGDSALGELQHAQGFDAKPDIVTEAELNQYVRAGEPELWRGDTKSAHTDNMMMGDYHPGLGVRGNGTYAQEGTGDPRRGNSGEAVARGYARAHGNEGLVMRMSVKQGARVIDYNHLVDLARAATHGAQQEAQTAQAAGDKAALARARALEWLASSDTSRYAVALGYDAVRVPDSGQWIVLNRSALRVSHQVRAD